MMEAIVAVYSDWGIGCCGTQPVVVPEDRKHFRNVTADAAVIVGRRTLADFPGGKPLKNRVNIVLTSQNIEIEGAIVVHSIEEALREAEKTSRCLCIGGESVYKQLMPYVDKVYVTKVEAQPDSDAFFHNLDADEAWRIADPGEEKEFEGIKYRFMVYERV
ncbi:MAG: dihydrofolate reductase [Oscillospiraceae bacterium]|nr:dihydrofolate reductase [Oscillospiraceae bacterium]